MMPKRTNSKRVGLTVAASQFTVSCDIGRNSRCIRRHIRKAAAEGTDAILFPEGALSGYGRSAMSFEGYDWDHLRSETDDIMAVARECGIWVFLGSAHFLDAKARPTNCIYIISPKGKIVDR
jgi:predicted amidohydrolase